ncbi:UbiH/UbiF/VisC/COQ6 family ubiquinone biosynthesis hydroxylase [uncultured Cocleimonas sp.]|uniref:UbiH/UbiF/VisC/COQ6 family ubiquinone biosynthesis hydroxylase n=1 Tax=uncultured Cocleimonas sp. TaxID=1051587 RepID=UPI00260455D4|nr:UbiH/UbiF/VisC/COQ6 family ubiquinone biosynthesis hydroxylase [uncultured Cocleimonas sp.]
MTDKLITVRKHFDVVINGGGMVGATLACLLAKAGRTVAVIEFAKAVEFSADSPYDLRVSAISRASQKAFTEIGAWQAMHEMRASPYESMEVWDAEGNGSVRFDAAELGEPDIGHIIENQVIQKAVSDALKKLDNVTLFQPDSLDSFTANDDSVEISLQSGGVITANLLVGADGANSSVRELAGIDIEFDDYAQSGLVAVVNTELHHQYTAWQRFQKTGPLAFLPLSDGSCSIVWTLPSDRADYFLSLSKNDFKKALAEAFDHKLGNITKVGKRAAFPLRGSQAKPYVMERIALVGDAAHTIHPLAGQGVNLGIKDVVELAKQLDGVDDVGKIKGLRRYERARRGDNFITMRAMEGFRLLFGHSADSVKSIRNFGMKMFNQLPLVKNEVIRKALGL